MYFPNQFHVGFEKKKKKKDVTVNMFINQFQLNITSPKEISHVIYSANQIIVFYIKCNTEQKWVNSPSHKTIFPIQ